MMILLAAVAGMAAFILLWRALGTPNRSEKLKRVVVAAAVVLAAVLLLLTASGRLHWLAALAAGALPFLRGLLGLVAGPLIGNFFRTRLFNRASPDPGDPAGAPPKDSTVATDELRMTLKHETGDMDGDVLTGPYAGRRLSQMDLQTLLALLGGLSGEDSRQLLGAYLDRRFPGWADEAADNGDGPETRTYTADEGEMDTEQALAVLGLDNTATRDDIVDAHRRLMQKLHPDRGGTDYLAATLNVAKKVLLQSR